MVAHGAPQAVVEAVEGVEIQAHNARPMIAGLGQGPLHPIVEGLPAEEAGEGVGERLAEELLGDGLAVASAGRRRPAGGGEPLVGMVLEVALQLGWRQHLGTHDVPGRKVEVAHGVGPPGQSAEEGLGGIAAGRRDL